MLAFLPTLLCTALVDLLLRSDRPRASLLPLALLSLKLPGLRMATTADILPLLLANGAADVPAPLRSAPLALLGARLIGLLLLGVAGR
jgi:hypothetical protein